jgi:hypothetical protein
MLNRTLYVAIFEEDGEEIGSRDFLATSAENAVEMAWGKVNEENHKVRGVYDMRDGTFYTSADTNQYQKPQWSYGERSNA